MMNRVDINSNEVGIQLKTAWLWVEIFFSRVAPS